jgi:SAM-dependent methyltransferase
MKSAIATKIRNNTPQEIRNEVATRVEVFLNKKYIRETSSEVAKLLVSQAGALYNSHWILEPSAGKGKVADLIKSIIGEDTSRLTCVELNKELVDVLKEKGYKPYHGDFLNFKPDQQYDKIIACPPFIRNVDCNHIIKMYEVLKPGGILVSLTSPLWMIHNEEHQVKFREFLKEKDYWIKMLPDNSFMEKEKTVPTAIIKIVKH